MHASLKLTRPGHRCLAGYDITCCWMLIWHDKKSCEKVVAKSQWVWYLYGFFSLSDMGNPSWGKNISLLIVRLLEKKKEKKKKKMMPNGNSSHLISLLFADCWRLLLLLLPLLPLVIAASRLWRQDPSEKKVAPRFVTVAHFSGGHPSK